MLIGRSGLRQLWKYVLIVYIFLTEEVPSLAMSDYTRRRDMKIEEKGENAKELSAETESAKKL